MKSIGYKAAINKMALKSMPIAKIDIFQASTILAILFNKTKEETYEDLALVLVKKILKK
jgi:rhamnogalacturonyl hydrolase YesR